MTLKLTQETNPKKPVFINFFHWSLNGLAAHDFVKMPLLKAFITAQNSDFICLSETFLDSSIDISDTRLNLNGYSLLGADHPSNIKSCVVCMYYKDHLPLIRRTDLSNCHKCLLTEITVSKEMRFLTSLYWSLSQNDDELETLCSNLIYFLIMLTNFNYHFQFL